MQRLCQFSFEFEERGNILANYPKISVRGKFAPGLLQHPFRTPRATPKLISLFILLGHDSDCSFSLFLVVADSHYAEKDQKNSRTWRQEHGRLRSAKLQKRIVICGSNDTDFSPSHCGEILRHSGGLGLDGFVKCALNTQGVQLAFETRQE
jgi:hypothetical protein